MMNTTRNNPFFMCNKRLMRIVMALLFVVASLVYIIEINASLAMHVGYYTRPLWDQDPNVFVPIPHFYAEDVPMEELCTLHGWKLKKNQTVNKVYDAIIFSVELDLLEVRIRELWDVVDRFVILESNATFTGVPKKLTFNDHKDRFAFAASKIHHVMIEQYQLPPGEGPFYNEGKMREAMDQALVDAGIRTDDSVIMSDVDEIVRAKTLRILKMCEGVPDQLHLQLKNYMYSFEYPIDDSSWRAHIVKYTAGQTFYTHGQITEKILSDAGWHCSFCFRTIQEFQFKMKSYSHADRVRYPQLLNPERIQRTICEGNDIFDMPPESYTYKDMIAKLGATKASSSGVGLPSSLLRDPSKYRFLLPGGCIREDSILYHHNSSSSSSISSDT